MNRTSNVAATGEEVKQLEQKIREQAEKLGDLIVNYRVILGGTGIPMPKPPRPMIEVVGSLTYFSFLLNGAYEIPPRWSA